MGPMTASDPVKGYLEALRVVITSPHGPSDNDRETREAAGRALTFWRAMTPAEHKLAERQYRQAIIHGWPT